MSLKLKELVILSYETFLMQNYNYLIMVWEEKIINTFCGFHK